MPLYVGNSDKIKDLYLGNEKILFAFYGSTLVYSNFKPLTFNVSSSLQTWVVPNGITKIHVDCVGSKGGGNGGYGGRVQCDLTVTPGQTLYIMVGAIPSTLNTPAYNASDIRIGGRDLSDRRIVAGGGGSGDSSNGMGGHGGGTTGGTGQDRGNYQGTAYGGTQTAGGAGAVGSHGSQGHHHDGRNGEFGLGGSADTCGYEGTAGAGGAGYWGGGGGGMSWNKNGSYRGSGGGGSSYTSSQSCSNIVHTQGYRNGSGYVTISLP